MSGSRTTTSRRRLVVVGAGMAATRLVEELVARGATSGDQGWQITVLGEEAEAPYNRILLSAVLEGTHRPEALMLRTHEWYDEHAIDLRLGERVLRIDPDRQHVTLVDGTVIGYDALVFATGSIPTLPPIRGLVGPDGSLDDAVHAFRSLHDCEQLLAAVSAQGEDGRVRNRRAVVVGGGLLGLQVARALGVRGVATEIVEGAEHLLHRQLSSAAGKLLARDLKRLGVCVYTGVRAVRLGDVVGATVSALGGRPRVTDPLPHHAGRAALRLDNGVELDTDLVVLAAGGRPATGLARAAGLTVRSGIVVDDRLTSPTHPNIHAIGDCAETPSGVSGFVAPAWDQAGILAGVLVGESRTYDGTRLVARLRATDLDVAVLGDAASEVAAGGEVVEVSNPIALSHRRLVIRDGRIVAATLVGDLTHVGQITQHFDRQTVLGSHEPGNLLLLNERTRVSADIALSLPDDAEICACAGVSAGRIRACATLADVRESTRATTGCGGCTATVTRLLADAPALATTTQRRDS